MNEDGSIEGKQAKSEASYTHVVSDESGVRSFCVYEAPNPERLREHVRQDGRQRRLLLQPDPGRIRQPYVPVLDRAGVDVSCEDSTIEIDGVALGPTIEVRAIGKDLRQHLR